MKPILYFSAAYASNAYVPSCGSFSHGNFDPCAKNVFLFTEILTRAQKTAFCAPRVFKTVSREQIGRFCARDFASVRRKRIFAHRCPRHLSQSAYGLPRRPRQTLNLYWTRQRPGKRSLPPSLADATAAGGDIGRDSGRRRKETENRKWIE